VNAAVAPVPGGGFLIASDAVAIRCDSGGRELWRQTLPSRRGIRSPAFSAAAAGGAHVFFGRTDGVVSCHRLDDGAEVWAAPLQSAVTGLVPRGGSCTAATADGRVHGVAAGARTWGHDVGLGAEAVRGASLVGTGACVWAGISGAGRVIAVDPASGAIRAEIALPQGALWTAADERIVVAARDEVLCYAMD
jgi:outer membrane protein assembly factor BamB